MTLRDSPWEAGTPCWVDQFAVDRERQREFYRLCFGWTFEDGGEDFGHYVIARLAGRAVAGIGERPVPTPGPITWITYLATDDLDAAVALVPEYGGELLSGVHVIGDAGRSTLAMDPTGAVFGLWEAHDFVGLEVANEFGSMVWNELMSTDVHRARDFYGALLDLTYTDIDNGPGGYATIDGAGPGDTVGGTGHLIPVDGARAPTSYWLTYFAVQDADSAAAAAIHAGGACLTPVHEALAGRTAILADPEGAVFAVIALTKDP